MWARVTVGNAGPLSRTRFVQLTLQKLLVVLYLYIVHTFSPKYSRLSIIWTPFGHRRFLGVRISEIVRITEM